MSDLHEVEMSIKAAQKIVDLGEGIERLYRNRDFKKVIVDGYFEQEAVRLVHLKSDPSMQSVESQAAIARQMDAIGLLRQYFYITQQRALMASKALDDDLQTRSELLMEGNDE